MRRCAGGLNSVLRQIARLLVPLNYARGERFDHDPAHEVRPGAAARGGCQPGVGAARS